MIGVNLRLLCRNYKKNDCSNRRTTRNLNYLLKVKHHRDYPTSVIRHFMVMALTPLVKEKVTPRTPLLFNNSRDGEFHWD
jgi:hypothetical protein